MRVLRSQSGSRSPEDNSAETDVGVVPSAYQGGPGLPSRDDANADVFDYIERFYNPKRRHSTLERDAGDGARRWPADSCLGRAPTTRSTRHSKLLRSSASPRSPWPPIRSSTRAAVFTEARRKRCGLTAVINRYAQQRPSQSSDTQRA